MLIAASYRTAPPVTAAGRFGLTDAGIKHLAGLAKLEWLDLRRTKASAAGVAALQKALPKCKIIGGQKTK
jgi:hypothetical protein